MSCYLPSLLRNLLVNGILYPSYICFERCRHPTRVHASSFRAFSPPRLQHNLPLPIMELHRDELPKLNFLITSFLEREAGKEVCRYCAHFCVREILSNAVVSTVRKRKVSIHAASFVSRGPNCTSRLIQGLSYSGSGAPSLSSPSSHRSGQNLFGSGQYRSSRCSAL
jgi:hypothetical protein